MDDVIAPEQGEMRIVPAVLGSDPAAGAMYAARVWSDPYDCYKVMHAIIPAADGLALTGAELAAIRS